MNNKFKLFLNKLQTDNRIKNYQLTMETPHERTPSYFWYTIKFTHNGKNYLIFHHINTKIFILADKQTGISLYQWKSVPNITTVFKQLK